MTLQISVLSAGRQLNEQAVLFIKGPKHNKLEENSAKLSKIFNWFEGDFTKNGSRPEFLNHYANKKAGSGG